MFVCFHEFLHEQRKIPRDGHSKVIPGVPLDPPYLVSLNRYAMIVIIAATLHFPFLLIAFLNSICRFSTSLPFNFLSQVSYWLNNQMCSSSSSRLSSWGCSCRRSISPSTPQVMVLVSMELAQIYLQPHKHPTLHPGLHMHTGLRLLSAGFD